LEQIGIAREVSKKRLLLPLKPHFELERYALKGGKWQDSIHASSLEMDCPSLIKATREVFF
jgi:hypothetical protein